MIRPTEHLATEQTGWLASSTNCQASQIKRMYLVIMDIVNTLSGALPVHIWGSRYPLLVLLHAYMFFDQDHQATIAGVA